MTGVGVLLGTAAYMSPEQAKGKPADHRSDIWAFGCVLYEMLTGRHAFDGQDLADTLALIVRGEPVLGVRPPGVPLALARILERTLRRDPRQRFADVHDVRIALDNDMLDGVSAPVATAPTAARTSSVQDHVVFVFNFGNYLRTVAPGNK